MLRSDPPRPSDRELAALADGSLEARRRARVEDQVAGSPELQALVEEQRRALSLVQGAAVAAPAGLRARLPQRGVRGARAGRAAPPRRRPALVVAAALCAMAVALAVGLATVGSSAPTVADAAALALRPPTLGAPHGNVGHALPDLRAAGLPYPYWEDEFGWKAIGVRHDHIAGRSATTVFYRRGDRSIGYTIVSGPFLSVPSGATSRVTADGTPVTLMQLNGRTVAVWPRHGHTCILSATGVPGQVLVDLAAWH